MVLLMSCRVNIAVRLAARYENDIYPNNIMTIDNCLSLLDSGCGTISP